SVVDAAGNQTVFQRDPAGNAVRTSRFGPIGGASPMADGPNLLPGPVSSGGILQAANLVNANLLASTENLPDELSRVYQTDRVLFINTIATARPPDVSDGATDIGKGNLTPGDTQAIPGMPGITILGRVSTRFEYDRNSRRTFTVQDDGDTNRLFYDGAHRLIGTLDAEGNSVEAAYDDNDNVIETRATEVSQVAGVLNEVFLTTSFYDSLNRIERHVSNLGQTVDYRYDSRNNLVAVADAQGPDGPVMARRSFPGGALTTDGTNRFGNVTRFSYDGLNRRTRQDAVVTASGQGDGINIGADLFGVRTATPTPDSSQAGGDGLITTRYDWDRNSLLMNMTDDNGNQTRYTYDNLDRRLTETKGLCQPPMLANRCDPPSTIIIEYDPDDNVVRLTDENGSVIARQFDAINRHIGTTIARAPQVAGTTAVALEYDGLSRLVRAIDNNEPGEATDDSSITFAYDSLNRVIEEMQQIGARPAKAISSAWRSAGLRVGCTYPNGRAIETTFDHLDRVDQIADNGTGTTGSGPIADYDYIGRGRVARRQYPINGTRLTHLNDAGTADAGYDGLRRPIQLRHLRADNSLITGFAHAYDRANNKRIEEKLHAAGDSELYGYDSAYRLLKFDRGTLNAARDAVAAPSANRPLHSAWRLDGVGNWQQVDAETRQHSSFNQIIGRTGGEPAAILSDGNGNVTDNGVFVAAWDYANRLRTVTRKADGARIAVYTYDATGRRVRKVVTNSGALDGATDFYLDGWREIEERDANDAVVQQYVYGRSVDEPLVLDRNRDGNDSATDPGDQRLFYHQNTLFSVFALTDRNGQLVEGYQYDAYGRQTIVASGGNPASGFGGDRLMAAGERSTVGNPYLFTGRRLDPETGLYYYRMRYMDAELGRFISRDPIGYAGGIGLYEYVGGRPTGSTDAMGLLGAGDILGGIVDAAKTVGGVVTTGLDYVGAAMLTVAFGGWTIDAAPVAPPGPPKPKDTPPSDERTFPWQVGGMARPGTGVAYETTVPPDKDLSRKVEAHIQFQMGAAGFSGVSRGLLAGSKPDMPEFRIAGGRTTNYKDPLSPVGRRFGSQRILRKTAHHGEEHKQYFLQEFQNAAARGQLTPDELARLTADIDGVTKHADDFMLSPEAVIDDVVSARPPVAGDLSDVAPIVVDDMPGLFGGGNASPQANPFHNLPTERIIPPRSPNLPGTERNLPLPSTERNIPPRG
ncbi:MAG: RHS repeat-associated core domain-containing protein, partial [Acidobacteria bacterium]|nr:RHS repeat-associated core domain-containing protein [Acidobacteriota bacterium]